MHVRELQWSCDSTVLALWLETGEELEEKGKDGSRPSGSYGEEEMISLSQGNTLHPVPFILPPV